MSSERFVQQFVRLRALLNALQPIYSCAHRFRTTGTALSMPAALVRALAQQRSGLLALHCSPHEAERAPLCRARPERAWHVHHWLAHVGNGASAEQKTTRNQSISKQTNARCALALAGPVWYLPGATRVAAPCLAATAQLSALLPQQPARQRVSTRRRVLLWRSWYDVDTICIACLHCLKCTLKLAPRHTAQLHTA